jgi:hypothetical protein
MPSRPKSSAKNEPGDYGAFETALKKVLSVLRSEIKLKKKPPKRVVSRVSPAPD